MSTSSWWEVGPTRSITTSFSGRVLAPRLTLRPEEVVAMAVVLTVAPPLSTPSVSHYLARAMPLWISPPRPPLALAATLPLLGGSLMVALKFSPLITSSNRWVFFRIFFVHFRLSMKSSLSVFFFLANSTWQRDLERSRMAFQLCFHCSPNLPLLRNVLTSEHFVSLPLNSSLLINIPCHNISDLRGKDLFIRSWFYSHLGLGNCQSIIITQGLFRWRWDI